MPPPSLSCSSSSRSSEIGMSSKEEDWKQARGARGGVCEWEVWKWEVWDACFSQGMPRPNTNHQ
jgi:hypothetical protein